MPTWPSQSPPCYVSYADPSNPFFFLSQQLLNPLTVFQFVGGTVGVSAANNIMTNVIISSLPKDNPNLSPAAVLAAGSTGLLQAFPNVDDLNMVINAYMRGLKAAWIWSIALSGLAFVISFGAEWKSVRAEDVKKRAERKAAAASASP